MLKVLLRILLGLVLCLCVGGLQGSAVAGTIIKLNLGSVSPDVKYTAGVFSTNSDGNNSTLGDQDTAVEFVGILESVASDINTATASFTISGLTPNGQAQVFAGSTVLQNFTSGSFKLYAPDNSILLEGNLAESALAGPLGHPSGGLFTTSFGTFTGGTLYNYVDPETLVLSMNFTGVQTTGGGSGFTVSPSPLGTLLPFTADAAITIAIPEPASFALLMSAAVLVANGVRRSSGRAQA